MKHLVGLLATVIIISVLAYVGLQLLHIQVGTLLDWFVGVVSMVWLLVIVTVPWDSHFRAKEVLNDAKISKRKDILVVEESLIEVEKIAKRSLIVAITLHIVSSAVLVAIAFFGVSVVGYYAAGAAILLTFFRPSVRYYEYIQNHLRNIQEEFRYPREDLYELLSRVAQLEHTVIEAVGTKEETNSWRIQTNKKLEDIDKQIEKIYKTIKQLEESSKKELNESHTKLYDHAEKILAEHKNDVAKLNAFIEQVRNENKITSDKLSSDGKLLESVREIANFVRELKS